jgi:hypothetical protein
MSEFAELDYPDYSHESKIYDSSYSERLRIACNTYAEIIEQVCRNAIEHAYEHGLNSVDIDEDCGSHEIMCSVDGFDYHTMLFGEKTIDSEERDSTMFERYQIINPFFLVKIKLAREGFEIRIVSSSPLEIAISWH